MTAVTPDHRSQLGPAGGMGLNQQEDMFLLRSSVRFSNQTDQTNKKVKKPWSYFEMLDKTIFFPPVSHSTREICLSNEWNNNIFRRTCLHLYSRVNWGSGRPSVYLRLISSQHNATFRQLCHVQLFLCNFVQFQDKCTIKLVKFTMLASPSVPIRRLCLEGGAKSHQMHGKL